MSWWGLWTLWWHREFLDHGYEEIMNGPTPAHVLCDCGKIWYS